MPLHATLVLEPSSADRPTITAPVTFTRRLTGSESASLLGSDPAHVLDARLVLRGGDLIRGQMTVTLQAVAGRRPHDVLPALQLLTALRPGDRLTLSTGPVELGRFQADESWPVDLAPLCRFVEALGVLQRHLRILIPIPHEEVPWEAVREAALHKGQRGDTSGRGSRFPRADSRKRGRIVHHPLSRVHLRRPQLHRVRPRDVRPPAYGSRTGQSSKRDLTARNRTLPGSKRSTKSTGTSCERSRGRMNRCEGCHPLHDRFWPRGAVETGPSPGHMGQAA
jgi:hypothetical protein